jgi:hypothetical protein
MAIFHKGGQFINELCESKILKDSVPYLVSYLVAMVGTFGLLILRYSGSHHEFLNLGEKFGINDMLEHR